MPAISCCGRKKIGVAFVFLRRFTADCALSGCLEVVHSISVQKVTVRTRLESEPALHRLQTEVVEILKLPQVRKSIVELGAKPGGPVGAQFGRFQQAEIQRWREVVRVAQIRMDG